MGTVERLKTRLAAWWQVGAPTVDRERRYKQVRGIALVLTLLVFVGHYVLPDRRVQLHPHPDTTLELYGYVDPVHGPSAYWIDKGRFEWGCHYRPSHFYGCGFDVFLSEALQRDIDFARFEEIEYTIHYQGEASRIRVYLRNFNPAYANRDDLTSTKLLAMNFRRSEAEAGPVAVKLQEFSVAEWWLRQRNIRREWALPEFDNIFNLGVDVIEPGEHRLRIDRLVLVGRWLRTEPLAYAIVALWMTIFLLEGVYRFYQVYDRSQQGKVRIRELRAQQQTLEDEKQALRELADRDPLTGVLNRAGFRQRADQLLGGGLSKAGCGLLLMDLDHFKKLNDTYGHDVGDAVLKSFADAIRQHLRGEDYLGRWGGEEFLCLMRTGSEDKLARVAEKLRELVAVIEVESHPDLQLTVSIGATLLTVTDTLDTAFKRADIALYRAKQNGRNCVELEL